MILLPKPIAFEWDKHNKDKNQVKHAVSMQECEEVFWDPNKKLLADIVHSSNEARYILLGATKKKRALFIVFTIRKKKIRIISARKLNKKELHLYEKTN